MIDVNVFFKLNILKEIELLYYSVKLQYHSVKVVILFG